MKKLKIVICLLLLAAAVMSLAACGKSDSGDRPVMIIDMKTNADGTTSTVKNGAEQNFFQVAEGETYDVTMTFANESGTINAYIAKDSVRENAVYTGNDIPSGSFTVTVSEAGEYQIYYEVSDYVGTYTYTAEKR